MQAGKDKRTPILEDLQRDLRLRLSFGLHPKQFPPIQKVAEAAKRLKELLSLPKTVTFGEVGPDYTGQEANWQDLRVFLEQLLFLLRNALAHMPIVVHCLIPKRSAREDFCTILSAVLGKDEYRQIHYFNGKPGDVKHWLKVIPNTFFYIYFV